MGHWSQGVALRKTNLIIDRVFFYEAGLTDMIRFDTVSGKMIIDTETDILREKIVITRGPDGVKVQYVSSVPEPARREEVNPSFRWDARAIMNRIFQFSPQ